ncbi:MAG TPA: hypothetical protein ENI97_12285 [Gammaproteobacteria bacterium]|nr:hypothetical protein [Gammaproteobacteria bacterium]
MDTPNSDFIKTREIHFRNVDPASNDAREAMRLLMGVDGIKKIRALSESCIQVSYDLRTLTLQTLETALAEVGFHLDNNLLVKMKRALFYYTEETQLLNLGYRHDQASSTLDIFVNCYQQREHGCRDERPEYLRHYL